MQLVLQNVFMLSNVFVLSFFGSIILFKEFNIILDCTDRIFFKSQYNSLIYGIRKLLNCCLGD